MAACQGDLEEVVDLGTERFVLRPIRDEDRSAYAHFIARMDPADLRRRFFRTDGRDVDFARYARIDDDREVAFVAVRESGPRAGEIVGDVRLHRYPGSQTAELSIIVRSDMQRRGVGRALMRKAIDYCAAHGLGVLAQILPENGAMIGLAKRSGMEVEHVPGSDLAIAYMQPAT